MIKYNNAAVAAMEYALQDDEGMLFLKYWFEGDFDVLREHWENIPDEVFAGADPLFKMPAPTPEPAIETRKASASTLRARLENTHMLVKGGVNFVSVPVLNKLDERALVTLSIERLRLLNEAVGHKEG